MTTNTLTFRQALNILEEQFDSTYRGISTVKEMTTDLMSAISFEGENPETVYHRFETKVGPNRIVKDDQIIALALHYVWSILTLTFGNSYVITFTMRIFFVALFVILGVNLGINLLDSNMSEIINERRETLEKLQHQL